MGREGGYCGERGFFRGGGVKKVFAKAGWEFWGRGAGVSWGVRGIAGKGDFSWVVG